MRWYVNINGRTTGPIEEQDLRQWVREGLVVDAYIRDETSGAWQELAKSPFARFLPSSTGAGAESNAPSVPPAGSLDIDDLFDHHLQLDDERHSTAAPKANTADERAASKSQGALRAAKTPVLSDPEEDLFDRALRLDDEEEEEPPPPPAPKRSAPEPRSVRKQTPAPPAAVPSLGPTITIDEEEEEPEQIAVPPLPIPKLGSAAPAASARAAAPAAERAAVSARAAAPVASPPPVEEVAEEAAPAAAAPVAAAQVSPGRTLLANRKRMMIAGGVALALVVVGVGGKLALDSRQRAQVAAERAAAEAKQKQAREAEAAKQAKLRAAQLAQHLVEVRAKIPGWLQEIEAARAVSDPAQVGKQLERIEAIRSEALPVAVELGDRVPPELSKVVAAAAGAKSELEAAKKGQEAVASAMEWLRQIQQASVTTKLSQIPAEIERVKQIESAAAALAGELRDRTPIQLSSVAPAATTAVALLENTKKVLEVVAVADEAVGRADALSERGDWIAADKTYEEAFDKLEGVQPAERLGNEPLPPELDVVRMRTRITSARSRIAPSVSKEVKRLELERKQKEREAEIEKQAAAYRARCGSAPLVSPFDGQLFGLMEAFKKQSRVDPEPFKIDRCDEPTMSTSDCWVSSCNVNGRVFGGAFRKRFAFSQKEGFWMLK